MVNHPAAFITVITTTPWLVTSAVLTHYLENPIPAILGLLVGFLVSAFLLHQVFQRMDHLTRDLQHQRSEVTRWHGLAHNYHAQGSDLLQNLQDLTGQQRKTATQLAEIQAALWVVNAKRRELQVELNGLARQLGSLRSKIRGWLPLAREVSERCPVFMRKNEAVIFQHHIQKLDDALRQPPFRTTLPGLPTPFVPPQEDPKKLA